MVVEEAADIEVATKAERATKVVLAMVCTPEAERVAEAVWQAEGVAKAKLRQQWEHRQILSFQRSLC